jgi:hypothetical protein
MLVFTSPCVLDKSLAWKKLDTPRPAAPNKALQLTASSVRSSRAPASSSS